MLFCSLGKKKNEIMIRNEIEMQYLLAVTEIIMSENAVLRSRARKNILR